MSAEVVHHLVVGPAQHGVTTYAELLLRAAGTDADHITRIPRRLSPADRCELRRNLPKGRVHLHFTDHLFGPSPEEAAQAVAELAAGRTLTATLHDLPQPSDGVPYLRRVACYVEIARHVDALVLNSDHEQALLTDALRQAGVDAKRTARCRVVALVTDRLAPAAGAQDFGRIDREVPVDREVAVLGFVYPGKGHPEVLEAMADLPPDVGLRVLGGPSPGHEDAVACLKQRAQELGRQVRVDGWIPQADLPGLLRRVTVPVFAPRHVSASGSLLTWGAAGRRPVTVRSRYTEELERRRPGSLLLVDDDPSSLSAGMLAALRDPAATVLPEPVADHDEVARAARTTFEVLSR